MYVGEGVRFAGYQYGVSPADYRPSDRPITSFMISVVPP